MGPVLDPDRTHRLGLALVVAGTLAVAFAAWGLATTATPAESVDDDAGGADLQDAVERFRLRLDRQAQLQAVGLALATAGVLLVAARPPTSVRSRWHRPVILVGFAASVVIGVARWISLDQPQFSSGWDRWVAIEGAAWLIWGVAFVVIALRPASPVPGVASKGA